MKWILAPATAVFFVPSWAIAQTQPTSPKEQVRQISEKLVQSFKTRNDLIFQYIADDALFADTRSVFTKEEVKASYTQPRTKADVISTNMMKNIRVSDIKVKGDTAVSVTRVWRSNGKEINNTFTVVLTFTQRDGAWKIISASHNGD